MKSQGFLAVGLSALTWSLPGPVYASAVIAGSIVRDVGPLAIAIQAALVLVAAIIVSVIGIRAFGDLRHGDMTSGLMGVFMSVLAAVLFFVIIPALVGGQIAAAAVVR